MKFHRQSTGKASSGSSVLSEGHCLHCLAPYDRQDNDCKYHSGYLGTSVLGHVRMRLWIARDHYGLLCMCSMATNHDILQTNTMGCVKKSVLWLAVNHNYHVISYPHLH